MIGPSVSPHKPVMLELRVVFLSCDVSHTYEKVVSMPAYQPPFVLRADMSSQSASFQLGSDSPLRPVPPLTCDAWRTRLDDLVRLESGAGQYRCRWSVRRRYCTATRKSSSTATSKCGLGLAPGHGPARCARPPGLCSRQIHRLALDPVLPALSAPSTFTMDMDQWAVAVLGKCGVGKSTLVQQVGQTLWVKLALATWLTRPP
jgi:hypothetical protein